MYGERRMEDGVGYHYVWYFLVFCTIVGTVLMSGKIRKELESDGASEPLTSSSSSSSSSSSMSSAELIPLLAMQGDKTGGRNSNTSDEPDQMP